MTDPIYRTVGAWGAGKGGNLTPAEVDGNFYALAQRIAAIETSPPSPVEISNIAVAGSQFIVYLSDGSSFGPFTLPVVTTSPPSVVAASGTAVEPEQENVYMRLSGTNPTVTIPAFSDAPMPIGSEISLVQIAAGTMTIAAATAVTLNFPAGFTAQTNHVGAVVRLKSIAEDVWDVSGDLVPGQTKLPAVVMAASLPTSDPHVAGQLWNSSGLVMVSVG